VVKDVKSENAAFSLKINQPDIKIASANISKDVKILVATQDGKLIETYDVESGKKLFQYLLEDSKVEQILYLKLSNDGDKIAAVGEYSIAVISVPDSKVLATINFPLPFSKNFILESLNFSPQDNFFVAQSENSINLFDASTGELKHSIPFAPEKCSSGIDICSWIAISPDEKFVGLTSFENGIVQLWSIENYRYLVNVMRTGIESPERAVGVTFTKDSRFLMWSSGGSGRLHFYDVKENKKLPDFPTGEGIEALFLTRYNELFLNGYENYYITDESNIISLLKGDSKTINSQVFNKTGFIIDSSYTPEFSQDELNSVLGSERPKFELLATDQNGLSVKSEKDFGGLEAGTLTKNKDGVKCSMAFGIPVFNAYTPYFGNINPGDCVDFAMIDVAKDAPKPQFSKNREEYFSIREYHEGDQLIVSIYINNGGAINQGNAVIAKDVKILTSLTSKDNLHKITATFTGSNIASLTGNVTVRTNFDEHLEVIPNSGVMYNNRGHQQHYTGAINMNIGQLIIPLKDLYSDWQYSRFFQYKIRVVKRQ
jgi:WD40 repeat protein